MILDTFIQDSKLSKTNFIKKTVVSSLFSPTVLLAVLHILHVIYLSYTVILGKNNHCESCNILLNSGAQISLIHTSSKVGGQEELEMKVYRAAIRSIENNAIFIIQACRIPKISGDNQVEIKGMVEHFGLCDNLTHHGNGPLDLLMGIDHACMHTSTMSWKLNFQAFPTWMACVWKQIKQLYGDKFLRVGISKPVEISDFWSMESMGVPSGRMFL